MLINTIFTIFYFEMTFDHLTLTKLSWNLKCEIFSRSPNEYPFIIQHYKVVMPKFTSRKKLTTTVNYLKCYIYKLSVITLKYLSIYGI